MALCSGTAAQLIRVDAVQASRRRPLEGSRSVVQRRLGLFICSKTRSTMRCHGSPSQITRPSFDERRNVECGQRQEHQRRSDRPSCLRSYEGTHLSKPARFALFFVFGVRRRCRNRIPGFFSMETAERDRTINSLKPAGSSIWNHSRLAR